MMSKKILATGVAVAAACTAGWAGPASAAQTPGPETGSRQVTPAPVNRVKVLADGTVSGYTDCSATGKFVAVRIKYVDGWPLHLATFSQELGERDYDWPAGAGVVEVDRFQATWHHSATWSATVVGGPDGAFSGVQGVCT